MARLTDRQIRDALQEFAEQRGGEKTFCPSEVARALAQDWRPLMDRVREVAGEEVEAGRLVVLQKGKEVDLATARGPIRLRQA